MLTALGAGALVFTTLSAADRAAEARLAYAEAVTAHARARAGTGPADAAMDQLEAQRNQIARWSFSAPNVDVAAAEIEERLLRAAADAGLPDARFRLRTTGLDAGQGADLVWLPVEIEAALRWDPTFSFLELVSSWPEAHDLTVFSVDIAALPQGRTRDPAAPFGRVRLEMAFPVRLETGDDST